MVNNEKIATMVKAQQEWERIGLSNNFVFQKVMQNKELCKKVLEEILGVEIERIVYTEYEKTLDIRYDSKAIRMDVYVKDNKDTVYNIEMQNAQKKDLPKRGRYYQDLIDLDLIEKGCGYKELNKSIVIFICTFDFYGLDMYKYTFNNICRENNKVEYGDETTKIVINTKGTKGNISNDMRIFLDAVNGHFSGNEFSDKLKMEVDKTKLSERARREFMYWYVFEEDIRSEALEQGLAQGREEMLQYIIKDNISEGKTAEQIIEKLVKNYELDEAKAREYYEKYK